MNTILTLGGRIGAIVLAALLVVGITMSLVDTSGTAQLPTDRSESFVQGDADSSATDGAVSDDTQQSTVGQSTEEERPSGEFHGTENQTPAARLAFGLFGLLQNFVIIGVIVLVVVWLERRFAPQPAKMT
jgi:hypothetical protein